MSSKVRYHRLSQSMESDEEGEEKAEEEEEEEEDEGFEENILFDSRLVNTPVMDRRDIFELELLGQPRIMQSSGSGYLTKNKRICVVLGMVLLVCLIILTAVLFPILNHSFNHGVVIQVDNASKISDDWTRNFNDSCVRLLDLDGDGMDDVVLAISRQSQVKAAIEGQDMKSFCINSGSEYPCGGELLALRGFNASSLWRCSARSTIKYIGCGALDVNGDQIVDCIVAGRHATLQAVDAKSGQ
ncbi:hypothetical protein PoB_007418100 [Plakobranchus ocellatus]|uniref:FAM234A/B beta-propeller domain-containing protein n=1 Tax=Plakobranchus ocellatus TaxID=259542 RepID=A0AAV4DUB6_9GAST|nr:hypothetical protein PoB_007418100 [Plakobranchus ocellatus]